MSSPDFDQEVSDLFLEDIRKFERGEYSAWTHDRDGALSLILLLDQFSRNIFRKKAEAFANDHACLKIAKDIISSGKMNQYAFFERMFILLVLEHSENGADTRQCVTEFMKVDREMEETLGDQYAEVNM